MSVNKFAKFVLKKKRAIFILFFIYLFLIKEDMYCILDLHLIVKVRRLNMQHKKTICKEKKIQQSVRSPQINQRRPSNYFGIF